MIEWMYYNKIGSRNSPPFPTTFFKVQEKLWKVDQVLVPYARTEPQMHCYDTDKNEWINVEYTIKDELNRNLREPLYSSDAENIYVMIQAATCKVWKFNAETLVWSLLLSFESNTLIFKYYVLNKYLYFTHYANDGYWFCVSRYNIDTKKVELIQDSVKHRPYIDFFEYLGRIYVIYNYVRTIQIFEIKDDKIELVFQETCNNISGPHFKFAFSDDCLYVFYRSENKMSIMSACFNFRENKVSDIEFQKKPDGGDMIDIFFIDEKAYMIQVDYRNEFHMFIGMDGTLETNAILNIATDYENRMKHGKCIEEMIEDIDNLKVPDMLKNEIRDSTIWKLNVKRRKLRRMWRRRLLKILDNPFQKWPKVEEVDDDEFILPLDILEQSDFCLDWYHNYPIPIPVEYKTVLKSVVIDDKIWLLSRTKNVFRSFQIHRFVPKTEMWTRVYFKHEELLLTGSDQLTTAEEHQIPLSLYLDEISACDKKIYVWADNENEEAVYEFDTETLTWNISNIDKEVLREKNAKNQNIEWCTINKYDNSDSKEMLIRIDGMEKLDMKNEFNAPGDNYETLSLHIIDDTIYRTWVFGSKFGITTLELNPNPTTRYLVDLSRKSCEQQSLEGLSGKMKKELKNIMRYRETIRKYKENITDSEEEELKFERNTGHSVD